MTAPFGRRRCPVIEREELGAYVVLAVADEAVPARPGQFYMLAAVAGWGGGEAERPFLARAISALAAHGDGRVAFLLEDVGPGTHRLCELEADDELWLVGPLGRGFEPPELEPLLVGGGVGIPPLAMFQQTWGGRALAGFRDGAHALGARLLHDPQVATDDGSVGYHGYVTDLLERELDSATGRICVYACGPPAMLDAVRSLTAAHGVPAWIALEAPMACGFGACFGCVVATLDGYKRVCVDGPVFEAAMLA